MDESFSEEYFLFLFEDEKKYIQLSKNSPSLPEFNNDEYVFIKVGKEKLKAKRIASGKLTFLLNNFLSNRKVFPPFSYFRLSERYGKEKTTPWSYPRFRGDSRQHMWSVYWYSWYRGFDEVVWVSLTCNVYRFQIHNFNIIPSYRNDIEKGNITSQSASNDSQSTIENDNVSYSTVNMFNSYM